MRRYQVKETKEIKTIICNQCGKEIHVTNGCPREGVFSADYTWGYFSGKMGRSIALICVKSVMTSCFHLSSCLQI